MRYSVVYSLGAYDHEIEENVPTLALAQALITGLQPYHDKPLEAKPRDEVRRVNIHCTENLIYRLTVDTPKEG